MSQETVDLLKASGKEDWAIPREEKVEIRGRGATQTYLFKDPNEPATEPQEQYPATVKSGARNDIDKTQRLIEWNTAVLSGLLKRIVARRQSKAKPAQSNISSPAQRKGGMILDEVAEVIALPAYDDGATESVDMASIDLEEPVVRQLTGLVTWIASKYRYVCMLV